MYLYFKDEITTINIMEQKRFTILILLLCFLSQILANNSNEIKDFCLKNNIHQKSVIIALSLSSCAVCYISPEELLDGIRKLNSDIPVYVVTDEDMAEGEETIFKSRFGKNSKSIIFITDKLTFRYMLAEKGGVPSVCCVSDEINVLAFKHLKHENMDDFFKAIKPSFQVFLINKIELKSKLISPKKYNNAFWFDGSVYLFHGGAGAIAKYNMHGENIKNVFIDSLPLDYLQIAQRLFPEKIYKSSEQFYKTKRPQRSRLIRPISLIKAGKDTLCALLEILARGDTMHNNKAMQYERNYVCLLFFDKDLNYFGLKFFYSYNEAGVINSYMQGVYLNSNFYLGRYDETLYKNVVAEYEVQDAELVFKRQFVMPQIQEEKNVLPVIPTISMSCNNIYLSCYKLTNSMIVSYTNIYRLNTTEAIFNASEIAADSYLENLYTTPKGNYVILATDKNAVHEVKGYDKNTKRFISSKEVQCYAKKQNVNSVFFVIDGYLQEYTYAE